jgi:hypothetical protein
VQDRHELVSFEDPSEERTWVFDVTFLTSNWQCIFGAGCKGVYSEDATDLEEGCCSHGAHLVDKADRRNLRKHAALLTDEQWQCRPLALGAAGQVDNITEKNDEGVHVTRVINGACMFLNRPGFAGGSGCALHGAALAIGERPLDWKPEVCWQLPIRRFDDKDSYGHVTSTIREWKRRDWGEGGAEFHWWCTDSPDAFVGKQPVWKYMQEELTEMIGSEVYDELAKFLRRRTNELAKGKATTFLPHPALKKKPTRA